MRTYSWWSSFIFTHPVLGNPPERPGAMLLAYLIFLLFESPHIQIPSVTQPPLCQVALCHSGGSHLSAVPWPWSQDRWWLEDSSIYGGGSINLIHGGNPNGWFIRQNPIKIDNCWGVPPFQETSIWSTGLLNCIDPDSWHRPWKKHHFSGKTTANPLFGRVYVSWVWPRIGIFANQQMQCDGIGVTKI